MEPLNNKEPHWTTTADDDAGSVKREPGVAIGPYILIASLGAAGDVWKANDTRLNRTVVMRFTRRSRNHPALDHPHICAILDTGADYVVTEFIDGAPMAGPMTLSLVLEYAGQILDALDAAHRRGIVDCGLKTSGILVTRQGVKLCDLGQQLCRDDRTDIFMFGCVLFEMLTGIAVASVSGRPLPSLDGVVPPNFAKLILQCLETGARRRWKTLEELKTALAGCGLGDDSSGLRDHLVRTSVGGRRKIDRAPLLDFDN